MIETPQDKEWVEVYYHPKPFDLWIHSIEEARYWEEKYKCTVTHVPYDLGFMRNCTTGIKVHIEYPSNHTEMYVEPLAAIHTAFFDQLSSVLWETYPYDKRTHKFVSPIHAMVAECYWDAPWKDFTPASWVNALNSILGYLQENPWKDWARKNNRQYEIQEKNTRDFVRITLKLTTENTDPL